MLFFLYSQIKDVLLQAEKEISLTHSIGVRKEKKNSNITLIEMKQQPTSNNTIKGFAAAVVAAICYGTNPLGTLELYADGFNSGTVLSYRYGRAVLMFAIIMLVRRESFAIK